MSDEPTRVKGRVVKYTQFQISVVEGTPDDMGNAVRVTDRSVRIGTDFDNELVLHDDAVSRHHCEIEASPDGLSVRDLDSTNGVLCGGIRIYRAALPPAAKLRVGDTLLEITPLSETLDRVEADTVRFGDLLGAAPRMRELFADLQRFAPTGMDLLVEGETGTGKELVARSVHRASSRGNGPFIVLDCAALAPTVAESELFGHEGKKFTGAEKRHRGLFEQAHRGTLFIDEIGELPKDLQPKLLRALESRQVRRLGDETGKPIDVDVRIVAATNRNLKREVENGSFRRDLYFRLEDAHVYVPPLREHMSDLPLLVEHFLSQMEPRRTLEDADISEETWQMLRSHRWPGNVRELRHAIRRLMVTGRALTSVDTGRPAEPAPSVAKKPEPSQDLLPLFLARRNATDQFERDYLRAVLAKTEGCVARAADIAETSKTAIYKLMAKHGITTRSSDVDP